MTMLRLLVAAAIVFTPVVAGAQDEALPGRVMGAVRSALAPVLAAFPATDDSGAVPADGRSDAPWIVRPVQPGERTIEILANPLNEDQQRRAAKAMADIEASILAAQRRAEAEFERAVAEAKRTGRSQDVDGISLSDEGVAGAKIDAESHVTIDVLFNQPSYRFEVASAIEPGPDAVLAAALPGGTFLVNIPAHTYRDRQTKIERYCERETQIYLGQVAAPDVQKRPDSSIYEIGARSVAAPSSSAVSSLVLRIRGNPLVIDDLLTKSNWASLLELLR